MAVPMGADLPSPAPDAGAPVFLASALGDAGTEDFPGNPLERIQIVKGSVGPHGAYQQAVHDVAVAGSRANLDMRTCQVGDGGAHSLCAVWQDPDFDPSKRAFYYARVVEVPSCRWNAWDCSRLREPRGSDYYPGAGLDLPHLVHALMIALHPVTDTFALPTASSRSSSPSSPQATSSATHDAAENLSPPRAHPFPSDGPSSPVSANPYEAMKRRHA